MNRYDALFPPDPDRWLLLDEQERILLKLIVAVLVLICAVIAGCSSTQTDSRSGLPTREKAMVAGFSDGEWVLAADSARGPGLAGLIDEEGTSDMYHPVADAPLWTITVSDSGRHVVFSGRTGTIAGVRSEISDRRIVFRLTKWAGGRFVVRPRPEGLRGELTLFGSGVPITGGVRGRLVWKP